MEVIGLEILRKKDIHLRKIRETFWINKLETIHPKGIKHELWNRRWHQRKIWVTAGRIQIKHTNEETQQRLELLTIHNIYLGLSKSLPTTFNAQCDCNADQQYHYNPFM